MRDFLTSFGLLIFGAIFGAFVNDRFTRRPRLITYYGHAIAHIAHPDAANPQTTLQLHTHSVIVRNAGRRAATNLRLGHNSLPDYSIWPPTEHRVNPLTNGANEILIPTLAPKDQIQVSYLYFPPTLYNQINTYVKSDEGLAKVVPVILNRQFSPWTIRLFATVSLVGALSLVYLLWLLGSWVYPHFIA